MCDNLFLARELHQLVRDMDGAEPIQLVIVMS
jgi:hypothetical protein